MDNRIDKDDLRETIDRLMCAQLATALASHADGLEYLSRYTGKPCIVLWSDRVEGNGALSTDSVIPLCQYKHNGRTAKQILEYQLGIRIVQ